MAMTPEGSVKAKVKTFLKAKGVWYVIPVSNGMGTRGVPDILCCHRGRLIALEIKAPGKRGNTTPHQEMQMAGIRASGGIAVVVDDVSALVEIFA
jgi:hypothetical protein